MLSITGLSEAEVLHRRANGDGNALDLHTSRSYWDIARTNLFNFFNNLLFAIGIALVALGLYNDAFTSVGLALVNALISAIQEIHAKRKLDAIALLTRPRVTVVRDGSERQVDASELVRGDIVRVQAGDQVMLDGRVVGDSTLEMDESLLTGESDLVQKKCGDRLLSGSFCVTGSSYYEVEKVGQESFANQMTQAARRFQVVKTPLQKKIDLCVRVVMLVVALISLVILLQAALEDLPFIRVVQLSAVLSGQIPYGLFFMVATAYAIGATAIAKQGALVQQVNAIESLSNIDVLCMDKTGTLTANRLRYEGLFPLAGVAEADLQAQLGDFVQNVSTSNATSEALAKALSGQKRKLSDEVPFASSRKWSGLVFDDPGRRGAYVLGALEMLASALPAGTTSADSPLTKQLEAWSRQGLRVLLFAYNPDIQSLHNHNGDVQLPSLLPLGLVALSDELRDQARETLQTFRQLGIDLKIISGDNPQTVAALARQAGLPKDIAYISGSDLAKLSPSEFDQVALKTSVFGRVTPEQKERLVESLMRQGRYVAMIGDGVNDALSLKKASLGIAMQSGSSITRNVADMVLMNDSFRALQPAFQEGQRIIDGLAKSMYLFLARVMTSTMVIIAISIIGLGFPYEPAQVALTLFTVGIPTFFLTIWAKPHRPEPHLLRKIIYFIVPASIISTICSVFIYTLSYTLVLNGITSSRVPPMVVEYFENYTGLTYNVDPEFVEASATIIAQTALSTFSAFAAFGLILFLEPPNRFFAGWTTPSSDRRPLYLTIVLVLIFIIVLRIDPLANYFGLLSLGQPDISLAMLISLVIWFFSLRATWRARLFERFLGIEPEPAEDQLRWEPNA
jgi:ATPase, P-type (transporting), HAD superfamily, subfamily IC